MPVFVSDRIINAFEAGRRARMEKESQAEELEYLKTRKQYLESLQKMSEIEKQMMARQLGVENLEMMMITPRPEAISRGMSREPGTLPVPQAGIAAPQLAPIEQKLMETRTAEIPGVPGLGVEGMTLDPDAMRRFILQQTMAAESRAAQREVATEVAKTAGKYPYEKAIAEARRTTPRRGLQKSEVVADGKRILANFDPETGKYYDPDTDQELTGVKPAPPQRQPSETTLRYQSKVVKDKNTGQLVLANYNNLTGEYYDLSGKVLTDIEPVTDDVMSALMQILMARQGAEQ